MSIVSNKVTVVVVFLLFATDDEVVMQKAIQFVQSENSAKKFTDLSNFTLRCLVCQIGLKGQKEAIEHAKQTNHNNFSEY